MRRTRPGAASLERAVQQHSAQLFEGGVDLDEVDEQDGDKIVHNVFGANTDQVVQKLGSTDSGGGQGIIQKLLPILAPIVLSFLASQFAKRQQGGARAAQADAPTRRWRRHRRHPGRAARRWRWCFRGRRSGRQAGACSAASATCWAASSAAASAEPRALPAAREDLGGGRCVDWHGAE